MKILVTGGNGFIGSHLCESLINSNYDVKSLDLKFDSNSDFYKCEKIIADIATSDALVKIVKNVDLVIHLAAVSRVDDAQADPLKCYNSNVIGILKIIEALRNSKTKLIFGSSREVYGEPRKIPVKESDEKNPLTVYGSSKLSGEDLLKTYRKLYGLDYLIIRFANVFGSPRDLPQRVIPSFISQAHKELPLTINGGNQVIDFTFIDDVTDGVLKITKKIASDHCDFFGEDYNFASGVGTSVADLSKIIKKLFDSNSKLLFNKERDYDVKNFVGDYHKAKRAFSFEPKHSLVEGLEKYKKRLQPLK